MPMAHKRTLAGLGLIVFGLTASLSLAVADDAPAPAPVQHPLFATKPDSIFADKLRQALKPAAAEQER